MEENKMSKKEKQSLEGIFMEIDKSIEDMIVVVTSSFDKADASLFYVAGEAYELGAEHSKRDNGVYEIKIFNYLSDCISPEAWERKQLNLITDLIKEREDGQNRIKQIIGIDSSPNKGIVESLVKTTVSCDSKLRDVLERTTRDVFKRCYAMGYREGNAALPGYDKDVVEKTKCYLTKAYETLSRR